MRYSGRKALAGHLLARRQYGKWSELRRLTLRILHKDGVVE
jgi:hypothetical protein